MDFRRAFSVVCSDFGRWIKGRWEALPDPDVDRRRSLDMDRRISYGLAASNFAFVIALLALDRESFLNKLSFGCAVFSLPFQLSMAVRNDQAYLTDLVFEDNERTSAYVSFYNLGLLSYWVSFVAAFFAKGLFCGLAFLLATIIGGLSVAAYTDEINKIASRKKSEDKKPPPK